MTSNGTCNAHRCSRCETLPEHSAEAGTLYLSPPLAHTRALVTKVLRELEMPASEPSPGVLALPLAPGRLATLDERLHEHLSSQELQGTLSLVLGPDQPLSLGTVFQAQPLEALLARTRSAWLMDLLRERRLSVVFQPIVAASNPSDVFAYECLSRGVAADGSTIVGGALFAAAIDADILFQLDLAARVAAIEAVASLNLSIPAFINFNPASIYNPTYCLRSTVKAVEEAGLNPGRIVFEVVESAHVADLEHLVNILAFYRDAGFRVALDDLGAGYSSLELMARLRPDFVKLDMSLIRDVDNDPFRATMARKLLETARELSVRTVAEGVETEAEWAWLHDNGADLVQGFFIGEAASPPPRPNPIPQMTMAAR